MTDLIVYGASDDLIEVAGLISDELNPPYGKPALVTVMLDDAIFTRMRAEYDPDGTGEWRIMSTDPLIKIVRARGEGAGDDADGCPGYSDKAVVDVYDLGASRVSLRCEAAASS